MTRRAETLDSADLHRLFATEFNKALGTTPYQIERLPLIRRLVRKLSARFDTIGWPQFDEDALIYVRQAIDRYA
jgi:hypothetical protein